MTTFQKLKQKIWRAIYPAFPFIERQFVFLHSKNRQKFHIGWLAPGQTLAGLKQHLSSKWGFGNHFVAWEDSSQVLSWRKLVSFEQQYHLRVYNDGEIRGHFELTPEAAPIRHFMEMGEQPKTEDFIKFLGPYVTTKKYVSVVLPESTVPSNDSEITFNESAN